MEENKTTSPKRTHDQAHLLLLLRVMARGVWMAVLTAIIFGCLGYIVADLRYQPQYMTRTTFVVHQRGNYSTVYGNLNAATGLAQSFSQVLKSDVMRKRVAEDIGVSSIHGEIEASVIPETNLLELRVTSDTPRMAYRITRAIFDRYNELTGAALSNISLEVLQQPYVPLGPSNASNSGRIARIAALVGAVLMLAYLGITSYLRDTIKSDKDVEELLDTKLVSVLHHERKNKTLISAIRQPKRSLLISDPTTGFLYVESVKKLRSRVEYYTRRSGSKVIMVSSVLENEGKTTVATNLAIAMGRKYKKVLLIDGDMRKPALRKILEYQNEDVKTLSDVLEKKAKYQDALIFDARRNIYTILSDHAGERASALLKSDAMVALLSLAREDMDVIIIDTPPMSASVDGECIAQIADAALLVVRQDRALVRMINDTIDVLKNANAEMIGCVLNNFYVADFSENVNYGFGGRYGYGGKYGKYGRKYGYGYAAKQGYTSRYGYGAGYGRGSGISGGEEERK